MGKQNQSYTTTLGNAIGDAIDALEQFTSDVRESADSMSETFPGAERTERYEEAAGALEHIDTANVSEVHEKLVDVKVTYLQDARKGSSRRTELSNLLSVWSAIADRAEDAAASTEDEDLQEYVEWLREVADALEGVEL